MSQESTAPPYTREDLSRQAYDPIRPDPRRHVPHGGRPLSLKNIIAPPATVAIFALPPLTRALVGLLTRAPRQLHQRGNTIGTKTGANNEKGMSFFCLPSGPLDNLNGTCPRY